MGGGGRARTSSLTPVRRRRSELAAGSPVLEPGLDLLLGVLAALAERDHQLHPLAVKDLLLLSHDLDALRGDEVRGRESDERVRGHRDVGFLASLDVRRQVGQHKFERKVAVGRIRRPRVPRRPADPENHWRQLRRGSGLHECDGRLRHLWPLGPAQEQLAQLGVRHCWPRRRGEQGTRVGGKRFAGGHGEQRMAREHLGPSGLEPEPP
mmetsp:Transcript_114346/g.306631  ORF Transcript_114346/g.306631 Transcript_114346/m.306631 type:complete len:209 (+) Transcript_114346:172-798(+)